MTLTEEQRAAIEYAISSLEQCGSEPEDPVVAKILLAMIDSSEHVTEPTKMIGFDLEAARDLANNPIHCPETDEVFRKCVAEIERLRGFETAARDLSNDLTRVAKERDELQEANTNFAFQAASISELEIEITELKADLEQSERVIDQQAARIGELEAQLTITNVALENATRKPNVVYITGTGEIGADATKTIDQTPNSAENMQKTGLDSPKMAIWQITEERKAAIDRGLQFLEWSYAKNSAHDTKEQIAVLWAMLDEVGQEIKNIKTVEI